jgi:hypothetical protein
MSNSKECIFQELRVHVVAAEEGYIHLHVFIFC